jgi:hypothetical protein
MTNWRTAAFGIFGMAAILSPMAAQAWTFYYACNEKWDPACWVCSKSFSADGQSWGCLPDSLAASNPSHVNPSLLRATESQFTAARIRAPKKFNTAQAAAAAAMVRTAERFRTLPR